VAGILANPDHSEINFSAGEVDSLGMKGVRSHIALAVLLVSLTSEANGQKTARDLTEASLEDLMNIEVTTVSKKEQKLSQAPAAVFVITQEDIRRSGMTAIPDLLRMVPGIQVGQMQGGAWGVSARGFNSQNSDKMLVLVDGRSVCSPINKGVFWDELDLVLEDIERIEVVRGPGATLWGANAVNGVVNIITKTAGDTQGALASAGGGDGGQVLGELRFGGKLGGSGAYRVFSKFNQDSSVSSGHMTLDGTESLHGGFRADWALSGRDNLTVEGDLFHTRSGSAYDVFQLTQPYIKVASADAQDTGGDLLVNWSRKQSDRSQTTLRVDFDHASREELVYGERHSTVDVDFQHQLTMSESHELVWGLAFRESASQASGGFNVSFLPDHRTDRLFSSFVQDQWKILGDRLSLILGSKFEHNNYSGFDIQPSARILWTLDPRHTAWAAVSRALRTPSYSDQSIRVNLAALPGPQGFPEVITAFGSPAFRPESLLAYELGYRLQAARRFSIDVATFYSRYRDLQNTDQGTPFFETDPQPTHLVIPLLEDNNASGESYGGEISSNWSITEHWRLIPSYSFLRLDLRSGASNSNLPALPIAVQDPHQQFQFRSNLDLSRRLQFDAGAYYSADLPGLGVAAYMRIDARLGYRPRPDFEISLAGRNLQGGGHQELISLGPYPPATVGRTFLVKLTWGF
jgi:iron complex outermembrane receptor protein